MPHERYLQHISKFLKICNKATRNLRIGHWRSNWIWNRIGHYNLNSNQIIESNRPYTHPKASSILMTLVTVPINYSWIRTESGVE